MQVKTMPDLGALVRSARASRGMTQADLAHELRVSRDWVVRLEKGHPRLEAQKVLDALLVLGLTLDVKPVPRTTPRKTARSSANAVKTGTWSTKNTGTKKAKTVSTKSSNNKGRSTTSGKSTGAKNAKKSVGSTAAAVDPFEALFGKKR